MANAKGEKAVCDLFVLQEKGFDVHPMSMNISSPRMEKKKKKNLAFFAACVSLWHILIHPTKIFLAGRWLILHSSS